MEPPKKKRKRNREGSDDKEEEQQKEQKTNFLFFDFECMQETVIHVPNLVVVQHADGHEWELRGPTRARTFAIGCLVEPWTGLCALLTTSKGMIRILKYLYDS